MAVKIQPSFTSGELAPSLHARVDLAKFLVGLATCRNFFVHAHGGVSNRTGTQFIAELKNSAKKGRLIPFSFNTTQTYILQFEDLIMRVIRDGGQVLAGAGPSVFELATPYLEADLPTLKFAQSADVLTITHPSYQQRDLSRTAHDAWTLTTIDFKPETTHPTGSSATAKTPGIVITGATQANPVVITATAHGYVNGDEVFIDDVLGMIELNNRRFIAANVLANTLELQGEDGTGYTAYSSGGILGVDRYRYRITAVADETFEESLPGVETGSTTITGATQANPVVITATAHSYVNGDEVLIEGVVGMTQINSRRFKVANSSVNTYELQGEDGTAYTAYTSGGTARRTFALVIPKTALSATESIDISWSAVSGISQYNIYRDDNGIYGFIGSTEETTFRDKKIIPDFSNSPPKQRNPFNMAGDYPSTVAYHQQRKMFGNTNNDLQKVWGTQTGRFKNMNVSFPVKDDDAISFVLNANQVNEIRHLVSVGGLLVLTSGSEWLIVGGGDSNAITPSSINADQQSFEGASHVPPLVIGQTVLFVQDKGSLVRDLGYNLQVDGYTGKNLSILANHLFKDKTLSEWAYAKIPDSIIWAVRNDGTLLGLTYVKEQDVWGWHRHDTDGKFESVASVSEGNEDATYFIVKRTINGVTKRYVERLHTRNFPDVRDAFFVDSGLSLDVPVTITGATQANPVVITATAHGFSNGDLIDLSDILGMTEINLKRYKAANITANTFSLTDQYNGTNINGTAFTAYLSGGKARKAVTVISGLTHLEGKTVTIAADGNEHPTKVVSGGSLTLDYAASRVHIGLPFVSDLETLDIEFENQPTVQNKKSNVSKVTIKLERSRGLFVGPNVSLLTEIKQREQEGWNEPINLLTGSVGIIIRPEWNSRGRVFIRQTAPLPLTILAIIPDVTIGDQ